MSDAPEELVRRTAALARLDVTDEEVARLAPQFARILDAFESLAELELPAEGAAWTVGGEPRVRPDEVRPSLPPERPLAAAPESEDGFYRVPRTVGGPE